MGRECKILVVIFFVSFIFLVACFHKQERNYAETFYPSGVLKSKKWFWEEGVFVDTAYYYFENGNPSSIEILNNTGLLQGFSKIFYNNGNLYQSIPYKNGIKEGFVYEYSNQGNLITKVFYLNDIQTGDCFWFYNNKVNTNSQYSFYDFTGHNLNLITYDSITGRPIKDMYQNIFIDSFNLNTNKDSFEIRLLLSNPPNCRSNIRIDYFSANDKLVKADSVSGKPYYLIKEPLNHSLKTIKYFATQYDSMKKENIFQLKNISVFPQ